MKLESAAPWVLAAATLPGCFFSPDTIHVRVYDPGAVALSTGAQVILPEQQNGVDGQPPAPRELTFRTDDDTLTYATVTSQRGPEPGDTGIVERWDTRVHLVHGEIFELVGQDGWVAALPLEASIQRRGDTLEIRASRQLAWFSSKTRAGYDVHLGDPRLASPDNVLMLSTPLANVESLEQRSDPTRKYLGGILLVPGTVFTAAGLGAVLDPGKKARNSSRGVGVAFAGVGLGLDVLGLYNLIRGSLHR